jgi:hypothetical protein
MLVLEVELRKKIAKELKDENTKKEMKNNFKKKILLVTKPP